MSYSPRDAKPGIAARASRATRTALAGGAVAAATAGVVATAWVPAAFAAADPLRVQLVACGTGASATWDGQLPVLTSGTAAAGTCAILPGGTAPGYAAVDVSRGALPQSEPTFTASTYSAGDPRMVIRLGNGHTLLGYPAASGLNGTDMAWSPDNGSTFESYQAAVAAAGGSAVGVIDAFIAVDRPWLAPP